MIRPSFLITFAAFFFCQCAWPQQRGSTVIIVGIDQQKAILAADSRATRGDGTYDDHYCKIIALGDDMLFAATGLLSNDSPGFPDDAKFQVYDSARKAYDEIKRATPESNVAFAPSSFVGKVAFWWSLKNGMKFISAAKISPWINQPGGGQITGVFVGTEGKTVEFDSRTLACTPQNIALNCEARFSQLVVPKDIQFIPFGTVDIGQLALAPESNESRRYRDSRAVNADRAGRQFAIRLAELTEDFSAYRSFVHGKIDAVEIRPGKKPYWIQQKTECRQNPQH